MNSHITQRFRELLGALPADVQKQALKAFRLFERDPSHPSLNFEFIDPQIGLWSARVSKKYRVLGHRNRDEIRWFWIGPHAEYERLIKRP